MPPNSSSSATGVHHGNLQWNTVQEDTVISNLNVVQGLNTQFNVNIGVVQQVLEKVRERLLRHHLVGVVEVPLLIGEPQRHPLQHAGVDLAGGYPPLLCGVGRVVVLEQEFRIATNVLVGVRQDLHHRGGYPAGKMLF